MLSIILTTQSVNTPITNVHTNVLIRIILSTMACTYLIKVPMSKRFMSHCNDVLQYKLVYDC